MLTRSSHHTESSRPPVSSTFLFMVVICLLFPIDLQALENKVNSDEMLRAHNMWRTEVGVAGFSWSSSLGVKAVSWANELMKTEGCSMVHSGPGENLYWASALKTSNAKDRNDNWIWKRSVQKVAEQKVVDSWASEKDWYDYNSNSCYAPRGETCGHYTQVIWENATEVGCGMAVCSDKSQIWVCNYSPIGNIIGRRPYRDGAGRHYFKTGSAETFSE